MTSTTRSILRDEENQTYPQRQAQPGLSSETRRTSILRDEENQAYIYPHTETPGLSTVTRRTKPILRDKHSHQ
jgi:hypothetical protein